MDSKIESIFLKQYPEIRCAEPLKYHCNFKIGGPADLFYILKNRLEIVPLIRLATSLQIPWFFFGGGTNLLFSSAGFRGLVIKNQTTQLKKLSATIASDSGATLMHIINFALKNGLYGMEPLYCLPGTIGGAVIGNAGSFGMEIKDILTKVEYFDPIADKVVKASRQNIAFSYRSSAFKDQMRGKPILLRIFLKLKNINKNRLPEIEKRLSEIARLRQSKQPPGATCGSYFKNKYLQDGSIIYAGKLIEECGLKGTKIGGAQISPKHANFILNTGESTSFDVLALGNLIKKEVKKKRGIELEEEVQVVPEKNFISENIFAYK